MGVLAVPLPRGITVSLLLDSNRSCGSASSALLRLGTICAASGFLCYGAGIPAMGLCLLFATQGAGMAVVRVTDL